VRRERFHQRGVRRWHAVRQRDRRRSPVLVGRMLPSARDRGRPACSGASIRPRQRERSHPSLRGTRPRFAGNSTDGSVACSWTAGKAGCCSSMIVMRCRKSTVTRRPRRPLVRLRAKALLGGDSVLRAIDPQSVAEYLCFDCVLEERSYFTRLHLLAPARCGSSRETASEDPILRSHRARVADPSGGGAIHRGV